MKTATGCLATLVMGFILMSALTVAGAAPQSRWDQPPDLVLRPDAPRLIRAGSTLHTQRFEVSPQQVRDRWIRAVDFRPGDTRVVQRAFFYIEKSGLWLGAWIPGQRMVPFPEGVAAGLPSGSRIVMEVQYKAADVDVRDSSTLALYFTESKPLRPLSGIASETKVQVPANSSLFTLRKEFTMIADSYALALRPQMKTGGRSVQITSLDPSGATRVLLTVNKFDTDIQPPYVFEEPLFIPKGTRIVAMASYQNPGAEASDDLFKLSLSTYPSAEYRPASFDTAVARRAVRKPAVKKPQSAKKAPAKKAPAKKAPVKKP